MDIVDDALKKTGGRKGGDYIKLKGGQSVVRN